MINNQRGSAIITVVAVAIILNITLAVFFFTTRYTTKASGNRRENVTALNIAEAGKERLYAEIRSDIHRPAINSSPITLYSNHSFGSGAYTVSYRCDSWADTLWIRSSGSIANGKKTATIDVVALAPPAIPINGNPTRGAVTARSNITVNGNITIDGRDHDTACNLTGPGTYAVSTTGTCAVDGSADIGGRGQAPVNKHVYDKNITIHKTVAEENAPLSSMFDSPEAFLGVPEGALDAYKFSSTFIDSNFHGIRYDTASYVGPLQLGEWASGILIVHNGAKTAKLKINGGKFRGLIICDEMDKINGDVTIRGAVVVLKGTSIVFEGMGNANICYSSEILTHLSKYCGNDVRNQVREISWKEVD